jgi:hypothetical protein
VLGGLGIRSRIFFSASFGVNGMKTTSIVSGSTPISSHSLIQRARTSSGFSPALNDRAPLIRL